jgi:CheY-like chemotaxis protein
MAKHKILLVEDNAQNRVLATFLLEEAGMEVVTATTGAEGLEKARAVQPDLILLDIQLPDIDGYELLAQLKGQPGVAHIPVVAVTSYAMAGEQKRALDLGCAGYVAKPIDTVNFAKQILEYIEGPRRKLKILVVEDRVENAMVIRENLQHRGYAVVHAANGREALKAMGEENFDLVITDLLMPEMDGYQLTHALKTDERFQNVPVIIYTATYTDPQDRALALDLGAAEFIIKPAETEPFMRLIGEVIGKAARGELPAGRTAQLDEAVYLKTYAERLVQKLEDKVFEAEEANRGLARLNSELESRVAQATAELRATIDKLNMANKELESFAYTVAHDLRAPLRAVRGLVKILEDIHGPNLPAEAQEICQRLAHNAGLMDRLIEDLLNYSKLGTTPVTVAPLSLNAAVGHAITMLSALIEQSHAQVEVQTGMPAVVGHEATLVQVIMNLVANAIKFVEPGMRPEVKIDAEQTQERVTLHVRDNGIGIGPQYQERIFQVFERLHESEAYPGTGVGLAIVKKGVEKMGGTCGVKSEPGRGSCFWVELPAASRALGRITG